ncbi:hypothetical protein ZWY2020_051772 [Hordeum vulgare]|nr:hypothetical protein ZWY2020_051772 [Hordeum vulgare]
MMAFKITVLARPVLLLVLALLLTSTNVGASRELHLDGHQATDHPACAAQACAETCVGNGFCGGICDDSSCKCVYCKSLRHSP